MEEKLFQIDNKGNIAINGINEKAAIELLKMNNKEHIINLLIQEASKNQKLQYILDKTKEYIINEGKTTEILLEPFVVNGGRTIIEIVKEDILSILSEGDIE